MLTRYIPHSIVKNNTLLSRPVKFAQISHTAAKSSSTKFPASGNAQLASSSDKYIVKNSLKLSTGNQSNELLQISSVVDSLLSMQGKNVGGLKDKLVVSSITQDKAAHQFCDLYLGLDSDQKKLFLTKLALDYEVDSENVKKVALKIVDSDANGSTAENMYREMKTSLIPPQNSVFTKIGQIQGGVKFLVDLRRDIIHLLKHTDPSFPEFAALKLMNTNLQGLLSYWFSMGFMSIEQVTWESPCALLQKVSEYEAVHPVKNWTDLKTRVGPYRRCFVYTHPSMPGEPVVILHVALTETIASSITSLVMDHRSVKGFDKDQTWSGFGNTKEDPARCRAAIFYSVTSTQVGLQGIELGTHLIKQAVLCLKKEFPHLDTFSTLSPIPGYRTWLALELTKASRGESVPLTADEVAQLENVLDTTNIYDKLLTVIKTSSWVGNNDIEPVIRKILSRLCTRYLYLEKRRNNALNSVANFHLRNGSCLWRINWLADPSPRGMTNSCGLMVNYRYYLDRLEENSNNYLNNFTIDADNQVTKLLEKNSKL